MPTTTDRPAIAAHRGGARLWPENSVRAFRACAELPIDYVEFDLHAARDGTPVVIHDATLDRTTRARGPVNARGWRELSEVRLRGRGAGMLPRLADILEALAGSHVRPRLEIKHDAAGNAYAGLAAAIVRDLDAAGVAGNCVVTSFFLDTLQACRDAGTVAPVAWLCSASRVADEAAFDRAREAAVSAGVAELGLPAAAATPARVAACAQAGLPVGVWTVNTARGLARMFDAGVGVAITDDPVLALSVRERWLRRRDAVRPP